MRSERLSQFPLLALAEDVSLMVRWLESFGGEPEPMWDKPGLYPCDATRRLVVSWDERWSPNDQAGILMVLRKCRISHQIFLHEDDETVMAWWSRIREPLAHAMGGRMGEGHSGRAKSAFPLQELES